MKNWLVLILGLALASGTALGQKPKEDESKHYQAPKEQAAEQAAAKAPEVGEKAPDFELPIATKDTIIMEGKKLSGFLGKGPVVLAFYPADWSGGCTKEVCTIRDNFSEFEKLGAMVIGISGDYVFSHKQWAQHHNLPFWLASDHSGRVAKEYDSYMADAGFNKRTVYVLDKTGVVRYKNLAFRAGNDDDFKALKDAVASVK